MAAATPASAEERSCSTCRHISGDARMEPCRGCIRTEPEYSRWDAVPKVQREPLTKEQIAQCVASASSGRPFLGLLEPGGAPSQFSRAFARAIERAHGIEEA